MASGHHQTDREKHDEQAGNGHEYDAVIGFAGLGVRKSMMKHSKPGTSSTSPISSIGMDDTAFKRPLDAHG
ncbi:hypothetical protein ACVIJ6_002068 [Bradyrhizobium sp. USDA 4369]